jgi:3',5'-nucleoside bisphosphate phosphatase
MQDYHLHTCVSDGDLDPAALVAQAARRGVTNLSITDHDTVGAYVWEEGRVFQEADQLGVELLIGIEMDADWDGLEVHMLGFGFDRTDHALSMHLETVKRKRVERARRELEIVNEKLGPAALEAAELFVPGREILMRPHFVRPLLKRGRFATYDEGAAWFRDNVQPGIVVPKPPLSDAIALIKGAGGWTALAHPAYYQEAGRDVAAGLASLARLGLDGLELDYPYARCSPDRFTVQEEARRISVLREAGERAGLRFTRGSDCHTAADFEKVYGR